MGGGDGLGGNLLERKREVGKAGVTAGNVWDAATAFPFLCYYVENRNYLPILPFYHFLIVPAKLSYQ